MPKKRASSEAGAMGVSMGPEPDDRLRRPFDGSWAELVRKLARTR
jgi:hypothetical protein